MSMRDYEVIKELGSGAFGTVVLVKQGSTKYCVKKVDVRRMPRKERDAAVAEARSFGAAGRLLLTQQVFLVLR